MSLSFSAVPYGLRVLIVIVLPVRLASASSRARNRCAEHARAAHARRPLLLSAQVAGDDDLLARSLMGFMMVRLPLSAYQVMNESPELSSTGQLSGGAKAGRSCLC